MVEKLPTNIPPKPGHYIWLNNSWELNNGGGKATRDCHMVVESEGWQTFDTVRSGGKIQRLLHFARTVLRLFAMPRENRLFIQLPQHGTTGKILLRIIMKRFRTVALLQDLDRLRNLPSIDEDVAIQAECLITSGRLAEFLPKGGKVKKIVPIQAWDYLLDDDVLTAKCERTAPVLFAGNLSPDKVPGLYIPCARQPFILYGLPYDQEKGRVTGDVYKGPFNANRPDFAESFSFGLVWENKNKYEELNLPHKFSLYLACGLPVIVWREAFIAPYVLAQGLGICISSLEDIDQARQLVSETEYQSMCENAAKIGRAIRTGECTRTAIRACA